MMPRGPGGLELMPRVAVNRAHAVLSQSDSDAAADRDLYPSHGSSEPAGGD